MTYKNLLISLLLTIILSLAAWTSFLSLKPLPTQTTRSSHVPDTFMEDVTAVIMDKFGKPKMKIFTPKLIHYNDNDTTEFTTPQLTLYRKSPQPWFVTSKFATAQEGADLVDFFEEVVIHHAADNENPATVIKTNTLHINTDEQIAQTKDPITLTQPNTTIAAIGMYADMDSGEIKLLSHARGEYVPAS